jgi:signal transduction histidine kinase
VDTLIVSDEEMAHRPARAPDFELESRTLRRLSRTLTASPSALLQTMVNSLMEACHAETSGMSLLDLVNPGEAPLQFRWVAAGGRLASFAGQTVPRHFSPCGTTLDADCTLLMREPARHFSCIEQLQVPIYEMLLVPLRRNGVPVGTAWVATHDPHRHFDLEDMRLIASISQLGAAASEVITSAAANDRAHMAARTAAAQQLADLTEEHRKLTVADREKGNFLATLTHELRNVMAPCAAALEIIKRSEDRPMRTRAREMLERQMGKMNRLIEDLLDTSRLASGKMRLDLEIIDLYDLVRHAATDAEARIQASGQRLFLEIPDGAHWVRGDGVRLSQVFGNLLTNAAKYGRSGGSVTVRARSDASHVIVSIKDTGIGIDGAMLAHIFDLFVQVEGSVGRSEGGLGIGLALVQRLVQLHGGKVEAHSAGLNQGSEFLVYLPSSPR